MTKKSRPGNSRFDRRQVLTAGAGLALSASALRGAKSWGAADRRPPSPLLAGIDTLVVLMMENRSFDQYFGMLRYDPFYPSAALVDGLRGNEYNTTVNGDVVTPYPFDRKVQADPPHSWEACHAQWNGGLNDGFAQVHAGPAEREVMGYYTRDDLPFSYWLADNFTLCDRWFAGVMGPTWPNRAVQHAATAAGLKYNVSYPDDGPPTIWDFVQPAAVTAKNYYAGGECFYSSVFYRRIRHGHNPTAPLDEFFTDAAAGRLPNICFVDPDYEVNDDHPSHDVMLGQALIASVYRALASSVHWPRCLLLITYDEHGGFYDHVPPPTCVDADPEYRQLGFRVPSLVVGPTVRAGAICSTVLEHASIPATIGTRFGLPNLTPRMAASADLSVCIDPDLITAPRQPPAAPPVIGLTANLLAEANFPVSSQPEMAALAKQKIIPACALDPRPAPERFASWMRHAQRLGAIRKTI